ncbi:hypothetical protein FJZ36_09785 [Candidatus Poribacteria bacterium]|nr:hypothetical protein [Candidatus Poribacteria bacterium]
MRPAEDRVRFARIVPLSLLWIALQSAIGGYMHGNSIGQLIANHLPMGSVFFLVVVVFAVNPILRTISPRLPFGTVELTIAWVMVTAGSSVPGYGMMEFLFPYLAAPLYFATPESQWREVVLPHLKPWLYVSDPDAVTGFFRGIGPNDPIPWAAWARPAAFAIALSLTFFGLVLCWSVLIRRQWVERERYAFPIVHVAHLVTRERGAGFFNETLRDPLLWGAMGVMFVIHLLRGLHGYFPSVPSVPVDLDIAPLFPNKPWNMLVQSWPLWFHVYFSVVGVTYFLHLDVAMSLWFFFAMYKFQEVFFSAFSITQVGTQQQVMGAVLVLGVTLLWNARRHLGSVLRGLSEGRGSDDAGEPMPYAVAIAGVIVGAIAFATLCLAMGMEWRMVLAFTALLWLMATVVGWHVSNAGLLLVNVGFSPYQLFTTVLGTRTVGSRNLVLMGFDRSSIPHWTSESLMPYALQSFRLVDMHGLPSRRLRLPLLMGVSIVLAVAVAFVASLTFIYRQGALNLEPWVYVGVGRNGLDNAARAVQNPIPPNVPGILSVGVGAAVMAFLLIMRHQFLWWPLHPLGYALGITWAPFHLWFSTLVGWTAKLLILRFGGFGLYRRWRPLFLGLILGEYFMTAIWSFIGLFTRVSYWGLPH